ncbi:cyclophilin-like fold protein [Paraburkholderia metrosideri]|nr:cyclophilin-like fold protein [Paraburkholderia metrosideri]
MTKVIIKVAGKELPGTLADNPTAREFASLLPLHIVMDDLFGREKTGPLPRVISTRGPSSDVYNVGEIGYWSPSHDVAIYYHHDGDRIPSPGVINIGRVDSGIETFNVPGSLDVIVERAP